MRDDFDPASALIPHPSLVSFPADLRTKGIQPLLDAFVAAVDLMDVVNDAVALRAERREQKGHSGADVRAGDLAADEPVAADDDGPVRIAQNDASAHPDQ